MLLLTHFHLLLLLRCQMLTLGPEDSLDFLRTMRMASYGFLISGPTLHLWFNFISKLFPKKDVVNTLKKMFLGQAVYGPIINSVFFSYNAGLQGTIAYMPPYIHSSGLLVLIELHKIVCWISVLPLFIFLVYLDSAKSFFDHKLFLQ